MTSALRQSNTYIFVQYYILMDCEQVVHSFSISEISKDSELLSLFNQCESQEEQNQDPVVMVEPSDLKPEQNYNERGYASDIDTTNYKSKYIKKHKPVINRKEQNKSKNRTKLYIEMLQSRVNQLQSENEKLKRLNKVNKQYIYKLNESEHHINGYFVGRHQVYQKLQKLNSEQNSPAIKIGQQILSLRLRQGAFGKDRLKAVNYYFREMVEMLLPEIQKYLIKIIMEKSDFFDKDYLQKGEHCNNDIERWRKQLLQNIIQGGDSQSIRKFLIANEERLEQEAKKFREMVQQFYRQKCLLIEQARKIQQVFDGSRQCLSIKQLSKMLCYIDRYRFEKNISLQNTLSSVFEKAATEGYQYDPDNPFKSNSCV